MFKCSEEHFLLAIGIPCHILVILLSLKTCNVPCMTCTFHGIFPSLLPRVGCAHFDIHIQPDAPWAEISRPPCWPLVPGSRYPLPFQPLPTRAHGIPCLLLLPTPLLCVYPMASTCLQSSPASTPPLHRSVTLLSGHRLVSVTGHLSPHWSPRLLGSGCMALTPHEGFLSYSGIIPRATTCLAMLPCYLGCCQPVLVWSAQSGLAHQLMTKDQAGRVAIRGVALQGLMSWLRIWFDPGDGRLRRPRTSTV